MPVRPQSAFRFAVNRMLPAVLSLFAAGCTANTTGVSYPADLAPPEITLSGITAGELVSGTRMVTAAAEDSGSPIDTIEIFVDGQSLLRGSFNAYAAQLSAALPGSAAGAQHTLLVHAYDRAGNLAVESVTYRRTP